LKYSAIILGRPGRHTLGLARSLGEEHVDVYLLFRGTKQTNFVQKSKYVKKSWIVDDDYDEMLKVLLDNFQHIDSKPVLFPGNEFDIAFVGKYFDILKERFICPSINGNGDEFVSLMDKENVNQIARDIGFDVPQSWIIDTTKADILIPTDIAYPCFVKPTNSLRYYYKVYMKKCDSDEELLQAILAYKSVGKSVLVQEFIDKDYEIVVGGCVLKDNNVIVPGVIEKKREFISQTGLPAFAYLTANKHNVYQELITKIIKKIGYRGIFDIEFLHVNEKDYFLEINFRNGGNGYAYNKAGLNIPYMWLLDAVGEDVSSMRTSIKKDIYMMTEFEDIKHVLKGHISIFRWLIDLSKTRAFMIFNLRDMSPFIFEVKIMVLNKVRSIYNKLK